MHKLLDTTGCLMARPFAERCAAELKRGDPDWEYRVVNDPSGEGLSRIEVYDEDGHFVGEV